MSTAIDMASALDLTLDEEQEAKFQALKNLHAKKIKSLMISIEAKDKEIAKLKVLGKDNRRTQMIQALKNKLREQELVADVLKEELNRKAEMSLEEINSYVIRKTLGGPKRFRPLSREELENKIAELEKKTKKLSGAAAANGIETRSVASHGTGTNSVRSSAKQQAPSATSDQERRETVAADADLERIAKLADEVNSLRITLDAKEGLVEQMKEQISRLRNRNSELRAVEEEAEFLERQHRELESNHERLIGELDEATRKLAASTEENMQLRAELSSETEQHQLELDGLQEQCEKLLQQNSNLLKRMAQLETDLEKSVMDLVTASSNTSSSSGKGKETLAIEGKLARLQEKLKACEQRCSELAREAGQVTELKNTVREKSIQIKELNRLLEEQRKLTAASSSSSSAANGESKDTSDLRRKVADLMQDNQRLREALAVATAGNARK
jgi:predicted RNase H-like nuclease (RuvC/YqgF family)